MRAHEKLNTFLGLLVILFLVHTRTVQMAFLERFKLTWICHLFPYSLSGKAELFWSTEQCLV